MDVERVAGLVGAAGAAGIADRLERAVREGHLQPGEQMPPIRSLARAVGVDANTVAAGYRLARERGLVATAGRAGTRVRSTPATTLRRALGVGAPAGVLDLSTGEPDPALLPPLRPPSGVWTAGYADAGSVYEPLRRLAVERLSADGVPAGSVTVVSGALDGIERSLSAWLRPGDRVAVEDPGWANVLDLVGVLGLTVVPLAGDDEGIAPDSLRAALRAGVSAVVVTSRAQNPTGSATSTDRGDSLRALLAASPQVLVIEDDHGADLCALPLVTLAGVTERWVHVRSASKAFGPDLRCAVLAGDETTFARVAGRLRLGPGWVSHLLQAATATAWTSHGDPARRAGQVYDSRRTALVTALSGRGLDARGRTGLNVWVPVPDEVTAVAGLLAAGYAVAPGSRYRIRSAPGIRITASQLIVERADEVAVAVSEAVRGGSGWGA